MSQLKRLDDDSYLLTTKYGSTHFPNRQKFYKFQLQCKHPETYEWHEPDCIEIMCYRCRSLVKRIPQVVNRDAELPDNWAEDGGRV